MKNYILGIINSIKSPVMDAETARKLSGKIKLNFELRCINGEIKRSMLPSGNDTNTIDLSRVTCTISKELKEALTAKGYKVKDFFLSW